MCNLCKKNISAGKETEQIKKLVHRISKKISPERIILFGSYARGSPHKGSDVDLLIIGNFKENFFDRIGKVLELNNTSLGLDPLPYTPKELEKIKKRDFFRTILKEGIVAY